VMCSGHCIALHRGARRGGLQAWWERRPGLQVPEVLIEASTNIVEKAESVWVIAVRRPVSVPCGWGTALLLYAKEGAVYMRAALFPYVWRRGEQCHGADDRPGESCSSRSVVARPVLVQERFRGRQRSGWSSGRRRGPTRGCRQRGACTRHSGSRGDVLSPCTPTTSGCRHSVRRGAAEAGMAAQG
jgi:hypothetical protein